VAEVFFAAIQSVTTSMSDSSKGRYRTTAEYFLRYLADHHPGVRTLDELAIIGLFDVVGPDSLEHVAEQVQLRIGVGAGGGLGSRDPGLAPWSVHEKGEARTGYRAEEKDGILAHCSRTFCQLLATGRVNSAELDDSLTTAFRCH